MSELYVEGIRESVVSEFMGKLDEDLLYNIINSSINKIGTGFAELIDDMFRVFDYGIPPEKQKELKSDLYKWINDTGHSH